MANRYYFASFYDYVVEISRNIAYRVAFYDDIVSTMDMPQFEVVFQRQHAEHFAVCILVFRELHRWQRIWVGAYFCGDAVNLNARPHRHSLVALCLILFIQVECFYSFHAYFLNFMLAP